MAAKSLLDVAPTRNYSLNAALSKAVYGGPLADKLKQLAGNQPARYGTEAWRDLGASLISGLVGRDSQGLGYNNPIFKTEEEANTAAQNLLQTVTADNLATKAGGELNRWIKDTKQQQADPMMDIYKALGTAYFAAAGADIAGGLLNSANTPGLATNQVSALEPSVMDSISAADVVEPGFGSLGTGTYGQESAITQGFGGADYVSPFSSGSITGVPGMEAITPSALGEIAAQTGLNTSGLLNAGGATWATPEKPWYEKIADKATSNPLNALRTINGIASIGSALTGQGEQERGDTVTFRPPDMSLLPKIEQQRQAALRYQPFFSIPVPTGLLGGS